MCHTSETTRPGCTQGFTAIELMVVVLLVAIFTALALPSFKSTFDRYRVDTAASEVTNALQFARSEAIRTRGSITVGSLCGEAETDWSCGIAVLDANKNPLKTIPKTDFKGVTVTPTGTPPVTYVALGYINSGDGAIHLSPSDQSFEEATYHDIVCLSPGGDTHVISSPNNSC
jgi:prepilin-type N-terminal cleavage/methylation domain-containing protein